MIDQTYHDVETPRLPTSARRCYVCDGVGRVRLLFGRIREPAYDEHADDSDPAQPLASPALVDSAGVLYLHQIHAPDESPHMHTHPWEAGVLVLSGGYTAKEIADTGHCDHYAKPTYVDHAAGDGVYRIGPRFAHRIVDVEPDTWTLVATDARTQKWGFLVSPAGHPARYRTMSHDRYAAVCEAARKAGHRVVSAGVETPDGLVDLWRYAQAAEALDELDRRAAEAAAPTAKPTKKAKSKPAKKVRR